MEVVELQTLTTELVDIRSLNDSIAITTEIAIALIVRHHHNNIGSLRCCVHHIDRSEQGEEDKSKSIHNDIVYVVFSQSEYTKLDDLRIKLYVLRFIGSLLGALVIQIDTLTP